MSRIKRTLIAATILVATLSVVLVVMAQQTTHVVTLAWDPNPETDICGYRIYGLNEQGVWALMVDVAAPNTQVTINDFPARRFMVRATAYNTAGLESLPSEVLTVDIDPTAPTGIRPKL